MKVVTVAEVRRQRGRRRERREAGDGEGEERLGRGLRGGGLVLAGQVDRLLLDVDRLEGDLDREEVRPARVPRRMPKMSIEESLCGSSRT